MVEKRGVLFAQKLERVLLAGADIFRHRCRQECQSYRLSAPSSLSCEGTTTPVALMAAEVVNLSATLHQISLIGHYL